MIAGFNIRWTIRNALKSMGLFCLVASLLRALKLLQLLFQSDLASAERTELPRASRTRSTSPRASIARSIDSTSRSRRVHSFPLAIRSPLKAPRGSLVGYSSIDALDARHRDDPPTYDDTGLARAVLAEANTPPAEATPEAVARSSQVVQITSKTPIESAIKSAPQASAAVEARSAPEPAPAAVKCPRNGPGLVATSLLMNYLSGGPRASRSVIGAATAQGISEKTLRRSAKALGEAEPLRENDRVAGWVWRLVS